MAAVLSPNSWEATFAPSKHIIDYALRVFATLKKAINTLRGKGTWCRTYRTPANPSRKKARSADNQEGGLRACRTIKDLPVPYLTP
jgi:hypothetical protein